MEPRPTEPWTNEFEKLILQELERLSSPYTSLLDGGVFNGIVDQAACEVKGIYGHMVTICYVKRVIEIIRERFYRFVNYTHMHGVKFVPKTKTVHVDGRFWRNLKRRVSSSHVKLKSKYNVIIFR